MSIAYYLRTVKRINRGSKVILIYSPGKAFVESLVACFYAGLIPVPIVPPNPFKDGDEIIGNYLKDCSSNIILTDSFYNRIRLTAKAKKILSFNILRIVHELEVESKIRILLNQN